MSFRKRNVAINSPGSRETPSTPDVTSSTTVPGIRPSLLDGRPTISTGNQSLDDLLGGHGGLATGHALLLEEDGVTDFSGTILKFFAAEGIVQGHQVHVVGVGEQWSRNLPGLVAAHGLDQGGASHNDAVGQTQQQERMKIAYRYERLGEFGAGPAASRGGESYSS